MKIGLVCPYDMFQRTGGVQELVRHLHDGLRQRGHQVKIITPRPPGFKGKAPDDYIILGTTTNFTAGFGTAGNWGLPADSQEVLEILRRERFDVINFHEPWAPLLAWQMLKHSDAAHVASFHANLVDRPTASTWVNVFTPYARGVGQKMHILTAVSPAPARLLVEKAATPSEKKLTDNIKYIPNGIELKTFQPPKKRLPLNGPDTKTIVYVGRLDRRKGVEWLIKAYQELIKELPKTYLIIAGEGGLKESLEERAKLAELSQVHFAGYVSEEEKRRLMGNADLVCIPSLFGESFGIVLVEAMAMGAPVIGGRNSGYIHVLKGRGRLGLVDPKDTADLANLMSVFLTDDVINNMMRQWGRQEAKQYDYPKILDQYESAYHEALEMVRNGQGHQRGKKNAKKNHGFIRRLFVR